MNNPKLPFEDLPPDEVTLADWLLGRKLDSRLNQSFYTACLQDPSQETQALLALLSQCEWYITTKSNIAALVVKCPSLETSWKVLQHLSLIGALLKSLAIGKIRVYPPPKAGTPLEVRVDELPIYRDSFIPPDK